MEYRFVGTAALLALAAGCSTNGTAMPPTVGAGGSPDAGPAADANPAEGGDSAPTASPRDQSAGGLGTSDSDAAPSTPDSGPSTSSAASDGGTSASDAGRAIRDAVADSETGATLPITSAGCGKAGAPTGSLNLVISGAQANYIVTLPTGYQPNTPVPLVFGFHGRDRTNADFENVDALQVKTEIAPFAVMVYPKSQAGPGWEHPDELPTNIMFFEALWTQMFSNYCIDPARVFVIGHSSGAIFSNVLACRYGDRLRGVGAVAGTMPETACIGEVAAMIVHGGQDPVIANSLGRAARDFYLSRNGCGATTRPGEVSPCVAYVGCRADLPVEWCEHTEPTYTNTDGGGHGYPTFASRAFWRFFSALTPKSSAP
jgi:poly(3-hydroxybutyrate) depolymerase